MYSLNKEQLFIGLPIPLEDNTCMVYPLSAFEIFKMSQSTYNYYINLLTMSKSDIEDLFEKKKVTLEKEIEPYDYLIESCLYDDNFLLELQKAFFTFIREKVSIFPQQSLIIVGNPKEKRIINKKVFSQIQEILRFQNGMTIEKEEEIPEDENAMQKKFRLRRKALEKAKKKQAQKKAEKGEGIDFYAMVKALIVLKIISWNDLKSISVYGIHELFDVAQAQEEYRNQINFLCAGADPKKVKTNYWIRKSYEK